MKTMIFEGFRYKRLGSRWCVACYHETWDPTAPQLCHMQKPMMLGCFTTKLENHGSALWLSPVGAKGNSIGPSYYIYMALSG